MRVLVWQLGRRGAGPRYATHLAEAFAAVPGTEALLSLAEEAEILRGPLAPHCQLPVPTYRSAAGLAARFATFPVLGWRLASALHRCRPDVAVCALPGPLDWVFARALRRSRVPFAVIVHDAVAHAGDGYPLQMVLQRRFVRSADAVIVLSSHVLEQVRGIVRPGTKLLRLNHPPFVFGTAPPVLSHGGPVRLLFFGRLLAYKGLDLLADAAARLEAGRFELRVAGNGPDSPGLNRLRLLGGVTVHNRWFAEHEIGPLLAWADAVVLPYREATQSGVAAAALAAGRFVFATGVGGLPEQLGSEPLAILCDPDAASLADALRRFIADPPRAIPPADARPLWRAHAGEILALVAGLAPGPGTAAPAIGARGEATVRSCQAVDPAARSTMPGPSAPSTEAGSRP